MSKSLPERPDMGQLKKQAKDLLTAVRAGKPEALTRIGKEDPKGFALHDAQLVLAREHGFPSWTKLKIHVDTSDESAAEASLFESALEGRKRRLALIQVAHPSLRDRSIYAAAVLGDAKAVLSWLEKDPSLATAKGGPRSWEPIIYACFAQEGAGDLSRAEVARLLLRNGADANSWRGDPFWPKAKETVLYGATGVNNYPELARVLLKAGANPNDGESRYHSPEKNHVESLGVLAEFGTDFSRVDGEWGNTPLYFLLGHYPVPPVVLAGITWLLEHGANPNIAAYPKRQREVPLHIAVRNRSGPEIVSLFLSHGADPTIRNALGQTPYALAVRGGQPDVARLLAEKGGAQELSPLDEFIGACMRADEAAARSRLAREPGLVASMKSPDLMLVHQAAREGLAATLRLMGTLGVDLGIRGDAGDTALHQAGHCGRADAMRVLIGQGADVNAQENTYKATPLGWVSHGSLHNKAPGGAYPEAARVLLAAGAVLKDDEVASPEVMEVFKEYRSSR
ncbi:MAG TPA: ankyrin repeat domain-containing protein [Opitutaceae bacterium]|jgi:ankyrin repeat protein|nr:ankyrin repeat domain-containing protein [Opitutaceae bacterium]